MSETEIRNLSDIPTEKLLEELWSRSDMSPEIESTLVAFQNRASAAIIRATRRDDLYCDDFYTELLVELTHLISQGKTSLEIAIWLWEKLNIAGWKNREFHGERNVLSVPIGTEAVRLKRFVQEKGILWTRQNTWRTDMKVKKYYYSAPFSVDPHISEFLFGTENMLITNKSLEKFDRDWRILGKDFPAKAEYLVEQIGLDIWWIWKHLSNRRYLMTWGGGLNLAPNILAILVDGYKNDRALRVNGALEKNCPTRVMTLLISKKDSIIWIEDATKDNTGLCLLT